MSLADFRHPILLLKKITIVAADESSPHNLPTQPPRTTSPHNLPTQPPTKAKEVTANVSLCLMLRILSSSELVQLYCQPFLIDALTIVLLIASH